MVTKKILLLNASTRKNGTSKSIINYLRKVFESRGQEVEIIDMIDAFHKEEMLAYLKVAIEKSDMVGMVSCCYVTTLAYPIIECLEKLTEGYGDTFREKDFFAIAQGGMPYLDVHEHCIAVSKCFAEKTNMNWLGGLILGLAPVVNGKELEDSGWIGKKFISGLNRMVEDIMESGSISSEAQKKATIKIPSLLNYPLVAVLNYEGKKDRQQHGVIDFDRMPYRE